MAYKAYRGYSWNISSYYPGALVKHSDAELRKEYAKLRAVAQKSIKRLGQSEFRESAIYRGAVNRFPATKNIKSQRDLIMALTDITAFLSAKSHSVSGLKEIRKEQIDTWNDTYEYKFVNKFNFNAWVEFLDTMADKIGFVYETIDDGMTKKRYVNKADAIARKDEIEQKFYKFLAGEEI